MPKLRIVKSDASHDDGVRAKRGVVVTLRDLNENSSRLFFDDVSTDSASDSISWQCDAFYMRSAPLKRVDVTGMCLSDEQYRAIGEALVARLLVLNQKEKGE